MNRRDELAANLAATRARIADACAAAGRAVEDVVLIAVTKTWPADDIRLLAELGVRDIGENRDQEAREKHASCADLGLRWHFVGQLQRNKVNSVASYADVVHSIDRTALVSPLGRAATRSDRTITGIVQVSLDPTPTTGRGGAGPDDVGPLADAIASTAGLVLGGVMAVAPADGDPGAAFARLADIAAAVRRSHPGATTLSAGMTGDLEAAIQNGATHVRVGTALLGRRTLLVG
jgi:pyridoxal phosphate enzyme (YggS family)